MITKRTSQAVEIKQIQSQITNIAHKQSSEQSDQAYLYSEARVVGV